MEMEGGSAQDLTAASQVLFTVTPTRAGALFTL